MEAALTDKTDELTQLAILVQETERVSQDKDEALERLECQCAQHREEIATLLHANKNQSGQLDWLKERLSACESEARRDADELTQWRCDKDELVQQKSQLQAELYSYMSRLSDLQIYKENMEMELRAQIGANQDKLRSAQLTLAEKETLIGELRARIVEMSEEYQSRLDAELNHMRFVQEQVETRTKTQDDDDDAANNEKRQQQQEQQEQQEASEATIEMLRAQLVDMEEKAEQLVAVKNDELNELGAQLDEARHELGRKHTLLSELGSTHEHELDELDEKLAAAYEDNKQLAARLDQLGQHVDELYKQIDELKEENSHLVRHFFSLLFIRSYSIELRSRAQV